MLNSATAQVHLHFVTYIPYIICIYIETLLPVIHTSKSGLTHCPPYALVGGSKSYQNDVIVQFYLYYILFSFTYRFPLSPFSPFLDFFFLFFQTLFYFCWHFLYIFVVVAITILQLIPLLAPLSCMYIHTILHTRMYTHCSCYCYLSGSHKLLRRYEVNWGCEQRDNVVVHFIVVVYVVLQKMCKQKVDRQSVRGFMGQLSCCSSRG